MGILKKKPTLAEGLVKQAEALEKQADAIESKALNERWAEEERLKHEKKMKKMEIEAQEKMANMEAYSQKAVEIQSLGNEGTVDAYRKLYASRNTEQSRNIQNRSSMKASLTGKIDGFDNLEDVNQALESFPFDKDPIEFRKIWIFLKQETAKINSMDTRSLLFITKQMEKMETAAEMNFDKPDYVNLLPEMKETISKLNEKAKENQKKALKVAGIIAAILVLLLILLAIFG